MFLTGTRLSLRSSATSSRRLTGAMPREFAVPLATAIKTQQPKGVTEEQALAEGERHPSD